MGNFRYHQPGQRINGEISHVPKDHVAAGGVLGRKPFVEKTGRDGGDQMTS